MVDVAQLVRVADCGSEGRGFESHLPPQNFGRMAEWLGRGLQNLVQRFESASDLTATRNGSVFFANSYRWLPPACFSAPPNMATAALSR